VWFFVEPVIKVVGHYYQHFLLKQQMLSVMPQIELPYWCTYRTRTVHRCKYVQVLYRLR